MISLAEGLSMRARRWVVLGVAIGVGALLARPGRPALAGEPVDVQLHFTVDYTLKTVESDGTVTEETARLVAGHYPGKLMCIEGGDGAPETGRFSQYIFMGDPSSLAKVNTSSISGAWSSVKTISHAGDEPRTITERMTGIGRGYAALALITTGKKDELLVSGGGVVLLASGRRRESWEKKSVKADGGGIQGIAGPFWTESNPEPGAKPKVTFRLSRSELLEALAAKTSKAVSGLGVYSDVKINDKTTLVKGRTFVEIRIRPPRFEALLEPSQPGKPYEDWIPEGPKI